MYCKLPTLRSMKIKFSVLFIIVCIVYLFLFLILIEVWLMKRNTPVISSVVLQYVIVHIDLKGSPPKLEYLRSLLPLLKDHGVNGLMMEYEDMFPYEGRLVNLSARNCYGRSELKNFLETAVHSGFEIIPLVQTFGHLEHALKLREFRHLRETPPYPDSICPSKMESRAMVRHMLEQVVNFHNSISRLKHIHVGCDEVFHINKCSQCLSRKTSNRELFLDYVKYLSTVIEDLSPDSTMLIWDDMLRDVRPYDWKKIDCFNNIEPVYWDYTPNLSVTHVNLLNYHKKFKNIWAASAFKGAEGLTATVPNIRSRILNHFNWMKLMQDYMFPGENRIFNFKGIILTGWSRYSHMDPPCELLPIAIPSLLLSLRVIKRFKTGVTVDDNSTDVHKFFSKYVNNDYHNGLICDSGLDLANFDVFYCNFESVNLYYALKQSMLVISDVTVYFHNDLHSMSSLELYTKSKYISMNSLMTTFNWCNDTLTELLDLEGKIVNDMKKYYTQEVIFEYVTLKMYYAKKQLKQTLENLKQNSVHQIWERGPLNIRNISDISLK